MRISTVKRKVFLGTAALSMAAAPIFARASSGGTLTRDDVRRVIGANEKIVTPNGISKRVAIRVNGAEEWLTIRGRDLRNPVLLFLHGGPGSPTMPEAWTFQSPWEDFFTVVQWDQRGAGRTYAANDPTIIAPTMNAEQLVRDTEVVVEYLLRTLGKTKLFVLGHSWGSYLGLEIARRYPEQLHAYIGTGQIINSQRSEADGYAFALREAKRHANAVAVRELESLAPYPGAMGSLTVARIGLQRKWLIYYGGLASGRSSFDFDADAWKFSPDYTDETLRLTDDGSLFSLKHLIGAVESANFEKVTELRCPLFLLEGAHDYETSYQVARDWFDRVRAPHKAFVTFADASHMTMIEAPGRYLHHLVTRARPLAVAVGDAAPDEEVISGSMLH